MTAVFAYAHEHIAFVAGDTLRVAHQGLRRTVCKLHHWSDGVVLAQAGEADVLSDLLQKVLPLMGFYPPTAEGLTEAFQQLHQVFWSKAEVLYQERGAGPVPEGTVLVAAAGTDAVPARIFKLDFQTGRLTDSAADVDADGTDAQQFQTNARGHLVSLRSGHDGVHLDQWAARCVEDAIQQYPNYIGAPIDALIARPTAVGDRILVHRRMATMPSALDLFRAS